MWLAFIRLTSSDTGGYQRVVGSSLLAGAWKRGKMPRFACHEVGSFVFVPHRHLSPGLASVGHQWTLTSGLTILHLGGSLLLPSRPEIGVGSGRLGVVTSGLHTVERGQRFVA